MKKNMLIFGIVIFCLLIGYYFASNSKEETTSNDSKENVKVDSESNSKDNGKDEENDEKGEETNSSKEDQRDIIQDLMEESDQFPSDYEIEGEKCKAIEETIERGDCFQDVNQYYLTWYVENRKEDFYFPFQLDQDHWEDVFYYSIDSNDELDKFHETEYYDEYTDPHNTGSDYQRGMDIVNEHWHLFSGIIPQEYRADLKYVTWTDTGEDMVFAVGRDEEHIKEMSLLFSHNILEYIPYNKFTLIHEFGHMLTMNEQQVEVDKDVYLSDDEALWDEKAAACDTYFTWGCMEEDSYLYAYYQQFWKEIFTDYEKIDWDSETDYKDFFFENEERFMNSYQGTSPEEDIADAFSQYVMTNSANIEGQSDIKYDKLQFFYEYDELVELRTMILENLYDLSVEDEVLY